MSNGAARITLHLVASLDGFIEAKGGDMAWFETKDHYANGVAGEAPDEFLKTIDCYVMGARTYELAVKLGWIYGDKRTVVLTHRTLPRERPTVEFYAGDLPTLAARLRGQCRSIWVVGGARVAQDFVRAGLVADIRLTVVPIILGDGLSLFDRIGREQPLHLKGTTAYKSGFVELWYEVRPPLT